MTAGTPERGPLVSVVIIFLNEARFLEEAIDSVLGQTFENWELCLVDDGSTDRSRRIAEEHAARDRARIRVVRHPDGGNHGMSASRNLGMNATTGRYLTFLDGDDTLLPDKLQRQVAELDAEPRAAMVVGRTITWYSWASKPSGQDNCPDPGVELDVVADPPALLRRLFADIPWAPGICAALFRREALEAVGGFAGEFRDMYEDQVVWVKLFSAQPVLVSSGALERYRQHDDSNCVRAERDGRFHPWYPNASRGAFLEWADGYLRDGGHADVETLARLEHDLRPVRHPTAPAEITAVTVSDPGPASLRGHSLECPRPGDLTGSERIRIFGWVLGRSSPAVRVEVLNGANIVAQSAVDQSRPDLRAAFPDDPAAPRAGYHLDLPMVGFAPLELSLRAVLADGTTALLATIRARRRGPGTSAPGAPAVAAIPRPARRGYGARPGERRAAILLYHRIAADPLPDPWQLSISPDAFAEQLELLSSDFQPMPLQSLVRAAADGALPDRAVAVTFDDGYADNLLAAGPLLERHAVPATVFLVSGAIGGQGFWWDELLAIVAQEDAARPLGNAFTSAAESRYHALYEDLYPLRAGERAEALSRLAGSTPNGQRPLPGVLTEDQVRELVSSGLVDAGAHTVSHPSLELLTVAEQAAEMRASRDELEALLDRPVAAFSYPHGKYSAETRRLARDAGFDCALAAEPAPVFAGSDPFELPRLAVAAQSAEELERRLHELFDD